METKRRNYRRSAKLEERLTPCQLCGYPISQRHHLFGVAEFGESKATIQLCANCHELYHIIERAFQDSERQSKHSKAIAIVLYLCEQDDANERISRLFEIVNSARSQQSAIRQQLAKENERSNTLSIFNTFFQGARDE